jgi:hypothetical protein
LSERSAVAGFGDQRDAALASAKLALIGIERSREALPQVMQTDSDPRLELLLERLEMLRAQVETRFPEAHCYVRRGVDAG